LLLAHLPHTPAHHHPFLLVLPIPARTPLLPYPTLFRSRGPTRLISPRRTFTSEGSSSRLVERSTQPSRVRRRSSLSGPSSSPGRGSRMVRNLTSSKGVPPRPARCWRKRTGEPIVSRRSEEHT